MPYIGWTRLRFFCRSSLLSLCLFQRIFLRISFSPVVCKSTYVRRSVRCTSFQSASLRHPVIFRRANYLGAAAVAVCSRCRLAACSGRRCPSITPRLGRTEEVASSCTYREPPRCIKARPTGLRLQRSRRAATCSTWTMPRALLSFPLLQIAIALPSPLHPLPPRSLR